MNDKLKIVVLAKQPLRITCYLQSGGHERP